MRPGPLACLALLSWVAILPAGAPAAAAPEALRIPCETYTLGNGLRVILHVDRRLPVVATNLWVYVGAKDEPPGRSGFAHLFEHLMFMGTRRVPTGQFDGIMEGGGGSNNATTSFDRTNYFCTGPSSLLPTLLWLDADRLEALGPAMTQEKLDLQREVVRNERRQSYEIAPYGKAELAVYEQMFPRGHPYRLGVIGSHEEIEAATVEDVKGFFARFYVPNNASLVVAGDFDPAEVKPLIERLFGSLPRGEDPARGIVPPVRLPAERRATVVDPQIELSRLSFVWHSPASYAPGDAEMDLIAGVLTQGKTSRLYKRLVYTDRLAQEVGAWQQSMALGSLFQIDVTAAPGASLAALERAVGEELARLCAEGPSAAELGRIVNGLESANVAALQSVAAVADRLNAYQFWFGTPDGLERDLDRYRQATVAAVRARAQEVLGPARLVLAVVPPAPATPGSRDERPGPAVASPLRPPPVEEYRLPGNGLRVWQVVRPGLPLVSLRLQLGGGAARDPAAKAGRTALLADLLDEGAGPWDALGFSQALDDLGARFGAAADRDGTAVTLETLTRNLEPSLALFAAAVTRPRLDPRELERVRAQAVAALEQAELEPAAAARRVALSAWFGVEHPYGQPVEGRPATMRALTLEDVTACAAEQLVPQNATLIVAGDVTRAQLEALLARALGGEAWPGAAGPGSPGGRAAPPPAGQGRPLRVLALNRPGAAQTVVRFALPGPAHGTPDRQALLALNTVFGGSFTSRLNANLREDKGYTYGAGSAFSFLKEAGAFVASSSVQSEVTGPALGEFLAEFARIQRGDVTPAEAAKARATREHDTVESLSTLAGLLSALGESAVHGRGPGALAADLAALAQGADAERLNALARAHLGLTEGVLVLVGDLPTIRAALEGRGLPALEVVAE